MIDNHFGPKQKNPGNFKNPFRIDNIESINLTYHNPKFWTFASDNPWHIEIRFKKGDTTGCQNIAAKSFEHLNQQLEAFSKNIK